MVGQILRPKETEGEEEVTDDTSNITAREAIDCGFCRTGQQKFFRDHGLDFKKHIREGTPVMVLHPLFPAGIDRILARRRAKNGQERV